MAKAPLLNLGDALLQGAKEPSSAPAVPIMPTSEMPMVLTLDEMAPNPDNPRTTRNPKYDEIKESIRARGLDTVPKMTKIRISPVPLISSATAVILAMPFCVSFMRKPGMSIFTVSMCCLNPGRADLSVSWVIWPRMMFAVI